MSEFWTYVHDNRLPILTILSMVVTAGIKTMPMPGAPFNIYEWFYDWTHQYLNITNNRTGLPKESVPIPKQ